MKSKCNVCDCEITDIKKHQKTLKHISIDRTKQELETMRNELKLMNNKIIDLRAENFELNMCNDILRAELEEYTPYDELIPPDNLDNLDDLDEGSFDEDEGDVSTIINFLEYCKYNKNDKKRCSICLEPIMKKQYFYKTKCFHRFHSHCLSSSIANGNFSCPLCRGSLR